MAQSDVTVSADNPEPPRDPERERPVRKRRRIPAFLVFGVIAATIEMGVVLALLYC